METQGDDDDAREVTRSLPPGTQVGPYRLQHVLGEGAMGWVYLGVHDSLARKVAIKALKPVAKANEALVQRFLAEARAVNIIAHENIVECTDTIEVGGETFVVMELLEGQSLRAALSAAGRMPIGRAVRIAAQIARAIGAAHDKGIVHRDLKPENVFLIERGGNADYVKVLDFGIARLRPELGYVTATQTGALMGTPAYMSPEQVRGERASAAVDVYALGMILYELVAGRLPFTAHNIGTMFVAQLTQPPRRLDAVVEVPKPLADLVDAMLAKDAAARPASMADVERALAAMPNDTALPKQIDSLAETMHAQPRRRRSMTALKLGLVVLAGGAVLAMIVYRDRKERIATTPAPIATPDAQVIAVDASIDAARAYPQAPLDEVNTNEAAYRSNALGLLKSYSASLTVCYMSAWKMTHKLPRKYPTKLTIAIGDDGKVMKVTSDAPEVIDDRMPGGSMAGCFEEDARRWVFPRIAFAHEGPVEITLPITLHR